jgi:hypothetical protein
MANSGSSAALLACVTAKTERAIWLLPEGVDGPVPSSNDFANMIAPLGRIASCHEDGLVHQVFNNFSKKMYLRSFRYPGGLLECISCWFPNGNI